MAEEKNELKLHQQMSNYFLSSLSNAIAAADLMAAQLEKQPEEASGPEMTKYLCILRRSQFQMLRLAENLRELTGLMEGTIRLHRETVDLNKLCADLAESVQALLPDITVSYKGPAEPCVTFCDSERIERLLLNLISNSLLHCEEGGGVRLQLGRTADTLQIVISDNGSGIPREKMETLFTDYLREPRLAEAGRGAGIGLSVAEQIARAHGGSLVITSEEGHGTKAVFSLPHAYVGQLRSYREPGVGRMRGLLIGLSDVLGAEKFQKPYL
jgi:signal transduction histidine kinase